MTADDRHQLSNGTIRPLLKRLARRIGVRRAHVAAVRMYGERILLASIPQAEQRMRGRILAYHAVGTPEWGVNDISPARFRRQMLAALRAGYSFVPASEIARTGGRPNELAITFDDGLISVAQNAAPILAELRIPWTFFVVSNFAEGKGWYHPELMLRWGELERLAGQGATIGSHSANHPNFGSLSADEAAVELEESRRHIASRLGISVTEFAIPFGRARDWSPEADQFARDCGYSTVYAYCEDRRFPGTVGRTAVTRYDNDRVFRALLDGAFDRWQEWF